MQTAEYRALYHILLALAFAGVSAGCTQPDIVATFHAQNPQKFEHCLQKLFPLESRSAAARKRIDSTGFFWAVDTQLVNDTDLVYLEVFDREAARQSADSPVQFQYAPDTATEPMRMEIHTEGSCPNTNTSLVVEGTVRFSEFAEETGERVTGELVSGTLIDARTGDVAAGSITGEWDFRIGSSQYYPTYESDEYKRNP